MTTVSIPSVMKAIAAEKVKLLDQKAGLENKLEKLAWELAELDGTERTLARLYPGNLPHSPTAPTAPKRTRGRPAKAAGNGNAATNGHAETVAAPTPPATPEATAAPKGGGKKKVETAKASKSDQPTLGDRVLALVPSEGVDRKGIAFLCPNDRPNHIGIAVGRHLRAGRLIEREGLLFQASA